MALLEDLIERPELTDISVDFPEREISMAALQEPDAVLRFHRIPQLGAQRSIGTRSQALVVGLTGGELVIYDRGVVRTRFEERPIQEVGILIQAVLETVASILGWDATTEPVFFDTDLIYAWRTRKDPVTFLREVVRDERLGDFGINSPSDVRAVGIRLFLGPVGDKSNDIRVLMEPLARDPKKMMYVRISSMWADGTIPGLADHLRNLIDKSRAILTALHGGA